MAMYEVGTVTGAASQARVTGATTKWSQVALGILPGSILVVYRSGSADLYAIKSVDSDTQLTLTRNITTAFSGASYGIITAETASTSSFANQLASAFAFWRSVVEGWSMALTGSGDITMTDPIKGTSVTVPAVSGMAKASDLAELRNSLKDSAKTSAENTFTQTQIFSGGVYEQGFTARLANDPENVPIGSIIPSPRVTTRFNTRGANGNVDGGQSAMWFEEHVGTTHRLVLMCAGFSANVQYWQFDAGGNINSSTRGGVQFLGTSDARLKHDITPTDGQQSVDRIKALELVTFVYNDDEQNRTRRGIIAQQAQKVDPQYVKQVNTSYMRNGEQVNDDRLQLDNNVIMMDTLAAVKVLLERVDELEERLSAHG
ncbi:tail fiber domain-containing protein [Klebsiella pneumoniae]|nr:tail fiber domain-containing protein [Klebsiella pneumoniae]WGN87706.1 tail fiber domain-containing protein [Klebsiella pneumoniae]